MYVKDENKTTVISDLDMSIDIELAAEIGMTANVNIVAEIKL